MRTSSFPIFIGAVLLTLVAVLSGCRGTATSSVQPTPPVSAVPAPQTSAPPPTTGEGVGEKAPNFTVTDIDGAIHSLSEYKGNIVAIDFWATYCKPCVKKLREYESIYQMYKSHGVEFLALSMDESDEVIRGWRTKNEVSFPLARLDDASRKAFFGDTTLIPIPQMRIVDGKGVIRYSFGAESPSEEVEAALKVLVAEKG